MITSNLEREILVLEKRLEKGYTLPVKQWEIMENNAVLLFSATNEETSYEQLLQYWEKVLNFGYKILCEPCNTDTHPYITSPVWSSKLLVSHVNGSRQVLSSKSG